MPDKNNNDLSLPEIDVKKNFGVKFVLRGVSLTFLIVFVLICIGVIVLFTVEMDKTINAIGKLEPIERFYIHSPGSGIFLKVFHTAGDTVKAGEIIAQLDSVDLKDKLLQLKNEYSQKTNSHDKLLSTIDFEEKQNEALTEKTEAQLLRAKASFRERLLNFFPGQDPDSILEHYKPGTHITLDYGKAEILSAEADIKNRKLQNSNTKNKEYDVIELELSINYLKEEINEVQHKLANLKIKSPSDGIILTENMEKLIGRYITKGDLIAEIYQDRDWKVILVLGENDIHKIKIGDKVKVEVLPLNTEDDKELYLAEVSSYSFQPVSSESSTSKSYRVTANIKNNKFLPLDKFRTDFTVDANIIVDHGLIGELLLKYMEELL